MAIKASEIEDGDSLKEWLEGQSVDVARVIASRAALRVIPIALSIHQENRQKLTDVIKFDLTLQVFRASFISWVARKYPTHDITAAAVDAVDAAYAAYAAVDAAYAAVDAVDAADAAAFAAANAAARAAYVAAFAAANAARAAAADAAFAAARADAEWLENNPDDINALINQPLWLEPSVASENYIDVQNEITKKFNIFRQSDLAQNTSFGLIADWYAALLPEHGKPRSLFGEKKDLELATQDDAFWQGKAQEVMDRVAELVGWPFVEVPPIKPASVVPIWSDGVLINDDRNLSIEAREELAAAALFSLRDEMLSLASDIESEANIDKRPATYLKQTAELFPETVPNTKELFALIRREATLVDYFDVVKEQWSDFLVSRYGAMVQEFTLELDAFDERQEFQRQRNKNSLKSYDIIELKYDMTMVVASMKTELAVTRIDASIPAIIEGIDGNKPEELNESPNRDVVVNLDSIESISNVLKQLAVRSSDDPEANKVKDMLNKNYVEGFSGSLAKAARKAGEEDGEKIGKTVPRVEVGLSASKDTRKWLSQKYPKLFGWLK